ncbi:Recombination inhibitory protein MutS2, partial [hydrothermal vent metagenome]
MAGAFAVSSPGKNLVLNIKPPGDIKGIRDRINLISEGRHLMAEGKHPGIEHFEELTPLFQKLRPADSVLTPYELTDFLPLFSSAINIKGLLRAEPSLPMLSEIASHLRTHSYLKREIESSIDREGRIADSASPELAAIREGLGHIDKRIRAGLEGLLRRRDLSPHIQEFYITERNGRWVIPVKRDSKGHVKGVVHDISNSGETLFIEPYETQALGNELESLRAEEKVEEFRVLKKLSAMLRGALAEIVEDYNTVLRIDCISALAAFSEMMGMTPPEINEHGYIRVLKGRHPLLWQALRRIGQEENLQPLDFELGSDYSCIVITGSNTGGKTVALKTVGVLQ